MSPTAYPLPSFERRLQERVRALIPDDEIVLAAVVVISGPRPGIEGLLAPIVGAFASILNVGRKFSTIAVTDRGVLRFENSSLRQPATLVQRFDGVGALGPFNDEGDQWMELDGQRYWIEGMWASQLFKMKRIAAGSSRPTSE